jgi:hypothetical protein
MFGLQEDPKQPVSLQVMQSVDLMDRIEVLGESVSGRAADLRDMRPDSRLNGLEAPNRDQMDQAVMHEKNSNQAGWKSGRLDWKNTGQHNTAGEQRKPVACENAAVGVSETKLSSK